MDRMFVPILLLAVAGVAVILLSGSLGAATSGRGFLADWLCPSEIAPAREGIGATAQRERPRDRNGLSPRGHSARDIRRASDSPDAEGRSGA
jgi:hypothetical protein